MRFQKFPLIYDQTAYLCVFSPGCLRSPPWGDEMFDCYVINFRPMLEHELMDAVAFEVAAACNDWVETRGPGCEDLHDRIDQASVEIGRQRAVGDGFPMTAWGEEEIVIQEIAGWIASGGIGGQEVQVVLVLGEDKDLEDLTSCITAAVARGIAEKESESDNGF